MAKKMVLISATELEELKSVSQEQPQTVYKPNDVEIRIEQSVTKEEPNNIESQVLELLPPRLQKKAQRILMHLRQFPEMIKLGENGSFMINGNTVVGGNFVDLSLIHI